MTKIILFNGPKAVGKDEAIKYLASKMTLNYAECKGILHTLTMTLFGITEELYWEIYNDRSLKELPLSNFTIILPYHEICKMQELVGRWATNVQFGSHRKVEFSIREAMIYVSEVVIKPRWGEDFFGKARVNKIKDFEDIFYFPERIVVDGSCAFVDELYPLIEYLGQDNILLLRIHRDGFTFEGDSRDYIPDGVVMNTVDIYNNADIQSYFDEVEEVVKEFLNE